MDCDVAIIGGGPSGCAAAATLIAKGISTIVFDNPNHRVKATETCHPKLQGLLKELGLEEAMHSCSPCYGIVSSWGRNEFQMESSITNPLGHSWFVHRSQFDSILKEKVISLGAKWKHSRIEHVHFEPDRVFLQSNEHQICSRFVVISTGSTLSAVNFVGQKRIQYDSLFAYWANLPVPFQEHLIFVEPTECGWWYFCLNAQGGAMACFVTDAEESRKERPHAFANWLSLFRSTKFGRRSELNFSDSIQINSATTGIAFAPAKHGQRWVLSGDAAIMLDPLGSSGIMTALESGSRAAKAVESSLFGESSALDSYDSWINGLLNTFRQQRIKHYSIEAARRSHRFWNRRTKDKNLQIYDNR